MFGLKPAASFDSPGLTWFNVERPLVPADLRGRFVVLDFWTASCINCLNALPTLRQLAAAWPSVLAVIGVLSPKFPAERDPSTAGHAIARYGIDHPVVHDPDLELWRRYGIAGWPTLVFINPAGMVLGDLPGEPCCARLMSGMGEIIRRWTAGERNGLPSDLPIHRPVSEAGRLRYPVKIKPLPASGGRRLWAVADSGHHQIVVFDDSGRETVRYGSGEPGLLDLDQDNSAFNRPEGLVADERALYVADTGNHAIRRIDRDTGRVTTVAGTGERGLVLGMPMAARDVALASVADLALAGNRLFFANAGTHQIGELDLAEGLVRRLAGDGYEDLEDHMDARRARFAQPRGLATGPGGHDLYVADSEASAIRRIVLAPEPSVETLVGKGLFDFGFRDGPTAEARMQYCCGVSAAPAGKRLFVTDSYNGAVRSVGLASGEVTSVMCDTIGERLGVRLSGPGGVTSDGAGRLLAADTNHHRIVEILPDTREARIWAE